MRAAGCHVPELVRHYIHNTEFLFRVITPREDAKTITVRLSSLALVCVFRFGAVCAYVVWACSTDHTDSPITYDPTRQVFDVQGVGVGDLVGDALAFLRRAAHLIQEHYVERSKVGLVWFGLVWFGLVGVSGLFMCGWRPNPGRGARPPLTALPQVIIIANCPSWFSLIWRIIKPLVNERTRRKVKIVSKSETLEAIKEFVDIENIPVEYGGKLR